MTPVLSASQMLAALNLPTLSGALKQTTKRATPVPKGRKKQR